MTIEDIIRERNIVEVLHFTRNSGLTGSLHTRCVKSRQRLNKDQELEFIFGPNAILRKDVAWLDYVNLSISEVNSQFFSAARRWHAASAGWWCILSFSAAILTHEGVVFATTNNIYPAVRREIGPSGLQALYANRVAGIYGNVTIRSPNLPLNFTTDEQAEVLYPRELSTEYLQRIYVTTEEDADDVHGQFRGIGHDKVDVVVAPEKFRDAPR
jgi:hypothetical protein